MIRPSALFVINFGPPDNTKTPGLLSAGATCLSKATKR